MGAPSPSYSPGRGEIFATQQSPSCGTDMPAPLPGACAKLDSQTQYPTLDLSLFPEDAVGPGKGEAYTTSAGQETLRPRPAIQQPDKPLRFARDSIAAFGCCGTSSGAPCRLAGFRQR